MFNTLDPVTQLEFKNYLINEITNIIGVKNSNAKIISTNKEETIYCKKCGCKINKNGKTKNRIQKYICSNKECKSTISETTGTVTYHSKLSFDVWKNIIDNLLDGFSIRRIAEENNISILPSFRLRHKVLQALKTYEENIKLTGSIQADEKYFSINLKGTKPNNMPRCSKKRKSKSSYTGISHHKICVVTAIDELDNMVFKIAGLGRGTTDMIEESLKTHLNKVTKLTSDSASAYQKFCDDYNIELVAIPSGFHSNGINNIAEVNNIHSQLDTWLSKFRGVSTRHLQEYLNWFNFIFTMKKKFDLNNLKLGSYKSVINNYNYINSNDIFKIAMPIDLDIAYAEYSYQS